MLVGSAIVPYITTRFSTWLSLLVLLAIHLGTNYLAVRAVCMQTLNRQRASIAFSHYITSIKPTSKSPPTTLSTTSEILTPEQVSNIERIFDWDGAIRWQGGTQILAHTTLGVSLSTILSSLLPASSHNSKTGSYVSTSGEGTKSNASFASLLDIFRDERYILWYAGYFQNKKKRFLIALKQDADTDTMLKAWLHAMMVLAMERSGEWKEHNGNKGVLRSMGILKSTLKEVGVVWDSLRPALVQAGWDLDTGAMETTRGVRVVVGVEEGRQNGEES